MDDHSLHRVVVIFHSALPRVSNLTHLVQFEYDRTSQDAVAEVRTYSRAEAVMRKALKNIFSSHSSRYRTGYLSGLLSVFFERAYAKLQIPNAYGSQGSNRS